MKMATHNPKGYTDPRTGLTIGAHLTQKAELRLLQLCDRLDPRREYSVTRKVVNTTPYEEAMFGVRKFEMRTFTFKCLTGAEAGNLADQAKFNVECSLGHHQDRNH